MKLLRFIAGVTFCFTVAYMIWLSNTYSQSDDHILTLGWVLGLTCSQSALGFIQAHKIIQDRHEND